MADLKELDNLVKKIKKIRGVILDETAIKSIVLTYLLYACNTYNIKLKSMSGDVVRPNSGCILLSQSGSGKSQTLYVLSQIFECIDGFRQKNYETIKDVMIGGLENSMIPLSKEEKQQIDEFYINYGMEAECQVTNPCTNKTLCLLYTMISRYKLSNIFFNIDKAGNSLFRDAYSKHPSVGAKEFIASVNMMFDGHLSTIKPATSLREKIQGHKDIGANFLFFSTAEFLKDYHVQKQYESEMLGGIARRLIYINCKPIDEKSIRCVSCNVDFEQEKKEVSKIFSKLKPTGKVITISRSLQEVLDADERKITIADEFKLLMFACGLAVWTESNCIDVEHWDYIMKFWNEIKELHVDVISEDSTSYKKICDFIAKQKDQKITLALLKDFCVRKKFCLDEQFKKWIKTLVQENSDLNTCQWILEITQRTARVVQNYAWGG